MLEIEKTYLAKKLPENLASFPSKEIIDTYVPKNQEHPQLRLRQNGDRFEITKKTPAGDHSGSMHNEETIHLSAEEFKALSSTVEGKRIHKTRYLYPHQNKTAEVDVFQEDLAGLVLVDFEFESVGDMESFTPPDFCLVDVTEEDFIAGGLLCGKSYQDIELELRRFGYKKLA